VQEEQEKHQAKKNNRYTFDVNKQKLQTPGRRGEGLRSYTFSIAEVITSGIGSVVSPIPRLITCASGYFSRCATLLLEIYLQEIIRTKIGLPKIRVLKKNNNNETYAFCGSGEDQRWGSHTEKERERERERERES
jgi:hypothetical protein